MSAEDSHRGGDISVGDNFVRTQVVGIVGALALIEASVVIGLGIVIVVAVKRSRTGRVVGSS